MTKASNLTDSIRLDEGIARPNSQQLEVIGAGYRVSGTTILHDISFSTDGGEVIVIVGQNGAGKSTLLKLLSGDLHPSEGDVLLDGIGVASYPPRDLALKRAVMAQQATVNFDFTAYEVAMMGRFPHGDTNEDAQIVAAALEKTESWHLRERFYPTLSGGEQARITLARVLAQNAPLMLLDEPTAALDLRHQQIVMRTARELASAGKTCIMIVHDLNLAARYADRILLLKDGQALALGSPRAVLTEAYISQAFDLPVMVIDHPQDECPLILPLQP